MGTSYIVPAKRGKQRNQSQSSLPSSHSPKVDESSFYILPYFLFVKHELDLHLS
jgi:hypothetical protein